MQILTCLQDPLLKNNGLLLNVKVRGKVVAPRDALSVPKSTMDHGSTSTNSHRIIISNSFNELSSSVYEVGAPDPPTGVPTTSSSVRMPCPGTSSSLHPAGNCGVFREDPNFPTSLDNDDDDADCEIESGQGVEASPPILGRSLTNRQKKKEAKMKFSGSRPKGRHRS